MSLFNLKNNALFLSCWYERFRPVQMVCFGVLTFSVMLLSFLAIPRPASTLQEIWKPLFYIIAGTQALVLLAQGGMFASHMGSRERTSETLDFHRNSPEPVEAKVLGLIFGSTWFEWAVFFTLFVLELPFVFLTDIHVTQILLFNASLILSGVFLHTTAVVFSLLSQQKKRGNSPFGLLIIFLLLGGPVFFYYLSTSSSPFFSHMFGVTALQYIYKDPMYHFNGYFYTLNFPLIVMQAIVQIPLLLLMINGIKRIFRLPNSPAWSKKDVIRFCCFLFFMIAGFFVASYIHFDEIMAFSNNSHRYSRSLQEGFQQEAVLFSFLFVAVGMLVSFFTAPSYFKCSKYSLLSKKGLIKKSLFDDGSTGFFAVMIYVGIGGISSVPYLLVMKPPILNSMAYFLTLSGYVIAFAGLLEFFNLGKFRNNKIFLLTVLGVWWVVIPWIMVFTLKMDLFKQPLFAAISPFFGLGYTVSLLWEKVPVDFVALSMPFIVAWFMWSLARQEHSLVEKQHGN